MSFIRTLNTKYSKKLGSQQAQKTTLNKESCNAKKKKKKKNSVFFFSRPSPTRILSTSTTLPRNHLGSDQLYPEEYGGYSNNGGGGGGYFNPLEAMTSSPLRSRQVQFGDLIGENRQIGDFGGKIWLVIGNFW